MADYIKQVELDGVTYNVAMQSAKVQRAVLFRLGKYGVEPAIRQIALAQVGAQSYEVIMLGIVGTMLSRIPEADFEFIADSMLYKVRKVGDERDITIGEFTGRMQDYVRLVVAALGVNFADFSQFLTLFQKSTVTAPGQEEKSETSTQESTGTSGDPASE